MILFIGDLLRFKDRAYVGGLGWGVCRHKAVLLQLLLQKACLLYEDKFHVGFPSMVRGAVRERLPDYLLDNYKRYEGAIFDERSARSMALVGMHVWVKMPVVSPVTGKTFDLWIDPMWKSIEPIERVSFDNFDATQIAQAPKIDELKRWFPSLSSFIPTPTQESVAMGRRGRMGLKMTVFRRKKDQSSRVGASGLAYAFLRWFGFNPSLKNIGWTEGVLTGALVLKIGMMMGGGLVGQILVSFVVVLGGLLVIHRFSGVVNDKGVVEPADWGMAWEATKTALVSYWAALPGMGILWVLQGLGGFPGSDLLVGAVFVLVSLIAGGLHSLKNQRAERVPTQLSKTTRSRLKDYALVVRQMFRDGFEKGGMSLASVRSGGVLEKNADWGLRLGGLVLWSVLFCFGWTLLNSLWPIDWGVSGWLSSIGVAMVTVAPAVDSAESPIPYREITIGVQRYLVKLAHKSSPIADVPMLKIISGQKEDRKEEDEGPYLSYEEDATTVEILDVRGTDKDRGAEKALITVLLSIAGERTINSFIDETRGEEFLSLIRPGTPISEDSLKKKLGFDIPGCHYTFYFEQKKLRYRMKRREDEKTSFDTSAMRLDNPEYREFLSSHGIKWEDSPGTKQRDMAGVPLVYFKRNIDDTNYFIRPVRMDEDLQMLQIFSGQINTRKEPHLFYEEEGIALVSILHVGGTEGDPGAEKALIDVFLSIIPKDRTIISSFDQSRGANELLALIQSRDPITGDSLRRIPGQILWFDVPGYTYTVYFDECKFKWSMEKTKKNDTRKNVDDIIVDTNAMSLRNPEFVNFLRAMSLRNPQYGEFLISKGINSKDSPGATKDSKRFLQFIGLSGNVGQIGWPEGILRALFIATGAALVVGIVGVFGVDLSVETPWLYFAIEFLAGVIGATGFSGIARSVFNDLHRKGVVMPSGEIVSGDRDIAQKATDTAMSFVLMDIVVGATAPIVAMAGASWFVVGGIYMVGVLVAGAVHAFKNKRIALEQAQRELALAMGGDVYSNDAPLKLKKTLLGGVVQRLNIAIGREAPVDSGPLIESVRQSLNRETITETVRRLANYMAIMDQVAGTGLKEGTTVVLDLSVLFAESPDRADVVMALARLEYYLKMTKDPARGVNLVVGVNEENAGVEEDVNVLLEKLVTLGVYGVEMEGAVVRFGVGEKSSSEDGQPVINKEKMSLISVLAGMEFQPDSVRVETVHKGSVSLERSGVKEDAVREFREILSTYISEMLRLARWVAAFA